MEGVTLVITLFSAVLGGVAGPVVNPVVERAQRLFRLRRHTKRSRPAIICPRAKLQDCPSYDPWIRVSKQLLADEPWMVAEFQSPQVKLERVVAALLRYNLWTEEEALWFRTKSVTLLGAHKPYQRLAILLWAIESRTLDKDCCANEAPSRIAQGRPAEPSIPISQFPPTTPVTEAQDSFSPYVARTEPALIDHRGGMHICTDIDTFVRPSETILEQEPWLIPQLQTLRVSLRELAPMLRLYNYWQACDIQAFRDDHVQVLGATECSRRLAVILWGIREHILVAGPGANQTADPEDGAESATDDSFVTCMTHPLPDCQDASEDEADAVIDVRDSVRQDSFGRRTDWRDVQSAFEEHEPYDGLPVSVSTVVVRYGVGSCVPSPNQGLCPGARDQRLGKIHA